MDGTDAERILGLGEDEIDALPFGLIAVDAAGTIRRYNAYESRLSRLSKDRVLGRNFFTEIAPCTAVKEFQGRFERFAAEPGEGAESFDFEFRFPFGRQFVNVTFLRSGKAKSQISILVNRYDEV
ncbi:MAG TPA: PAS domain-containing protein [Candidatus Elarobacter sp.]|jgi:photoactive yellow protein|nr:PAS domain-containing protein [Candidatus Elarobacter sp.]